MLNKKKTISLALAMSIVVGSLFTACSKNAQLPENSIDPGIAFLEAQESKDPARVNDAIHAIEQRHLEEEREKLIEDLSSGKQDVWAMFKDSVVLGDSRAVGFSYYGFLADEQVFATSGETIFAVKDHYEEIHAANPSYIYLCYGLNDIIFWDGAADYQQGFGEMLTELQAEFPNATIVVSSIIAIYDPAFEKDSDWYQLPEYSAAVKEYCEENGYIFADTDALCDEHSKLWQPDGIHLQPDFYPYWGANLIVSMLEGPKNVVEVGETADAPE